MVQSPHFCKLSNTNIGQHFLNLINKHFHKKNPLRKTIKIFYSYTNNMYKIINSHNNHIRSKFYGINNKPGMELPVIVEIAKIVHSKEIAELRRLYTKLLFTPKKISSITVFTLEFLRENGNKDFTPIGILFPTQN